MAALRALADLREAEAGLSDEKALARVYVDPHTREGHPVAGYWRKPFPRKPGDVFSPAPGERPPWDPPLDPTIEQRLRMEKLDQYPPKGPAAKKLLGAAKDTQDLHSYVDRQGVRHYSAERLKLHKAIIDYFLSQHSGEPTFDKPLGKKGKRLTAKAKPAVLFLAGGTATGKSSVLTQAIETGSLGEEFIPEDHVMINADLVKQMLPEFEQLAEVGERAASGVVHEESSDLAAEIRAETVRRKFNMVVDGTGDSGRAKFMRKLWGAADEGYDVRVFMVDLPVNVAIERAVLRGDIEGRYVPVPEIERSHYGSSARHLDWRELDIVSRWQVWSRNVPPGSPDILVADGGKGHYSVHDNYEYARLLDKARRGEHV